MDPTQPNPWVNPTHGQLCPGYIVSEWASNVVILLVAVGCVVVSVVVHVLFADHRQRYIRATRPVAALSPLTYLLTYSALWLLTSDMSSRMSWDMCWNVSLVRTVPCWLAWAHSGALFKSRLVLPFWYRLTQAVLEKRPLNGCSSSSTSSGPLWVSQLLVGNRVVWFTYSNYCLNFLIQLVTGLKEAVKWM